jgi:hypothetical protein
MSLHTLLIRLQRVVYFLSCPPPNLLARVLLIESESDPSIPLPDVILHLPLAIPASVQ